LKPFNAFKADVASLSVPNSIIPIPPPANFTSLYPEYCLNSILNINSLHSGGKFFANKRDDGVADACTPPPPDFFFASPESAADCPAAIIIVGGTSIDVGSETEVIVEAEAEFNFANFA